MDQFEIRKLALELALRIRPPAAKNTAQMFVEDAKRFEKFLTVPPSPVPAEPPPQ